MKDFRATFRCVGLGVLSFFVVKEVEDSTNSDTLGAESENNVIVGFETTETNRDNLRKRCCRDLDVGMSVLMVMLMSMSMSMPFRETNWMMFCVCIERVNMKGESWKSSLSDF